MAEAETEDRAESEAETPKRRLPSFDVAQLRAPKNWPWLAGGAFIVLLLGWMIFGGKKDEDPYRTTPADRGEITRVVSATGALQPLVSVNVGSTVSGPVQSVDVDFNSQVRRGQVLARLDPTSFQQRVDQAAAQLRQAQASLAVAESDFQRYARLAQEGFASDQLMAQQRSTRDRARADVTLANAALASARTDLDRSVIRSPIDGVVVDRQVNVGQSVAASFQAPTLFVIAQDLSRLQAEITVDEADIGEVRETMPVRFTVDAFPDQEFDGAVSQVRQKGIDTNGVVSYTVVVQADNPGRRLLPGMTANAEIIVEQVPSALRIANAALRYRPSDEALQRQGQALLGGGERGQGGGGAQTAQGGGERGQGGGMRMGGRMFEQLNLTPAQQTQVQEIMRNVMASVGERPGPDADDATRRAFGRRVREAAMRQIEPILTPAQRQQLAQLRAQGANGGGAAQRRETPARAAVIWVLRDNRPTPVRVMIGVADDSFTAVVSGDLHEGDQVITGGGPQSAADRAGKQRQQSPMGGGGVRIRGV